MRLFEHPDFEQAIIRATGGEYARSARFGNSGRIKEVFGGYLSHRVFARLTTHTSGGGGRGKGCQCALSIGVPTILRSST